MKTASAITIAMIKNPQGHDWQAQIQVEYKNTPGTQALPISGDNPMQLLEHAKNAPARKFLKDGASQ